MPALRKASHVRQGAAVQDGQFQVVQLHDHVVHAHADERGEQVFSGGDQHALAHQAGGVADLGHVAADGGNLKVVQVSAAEDDARSGRSGQQAHGYRRARMEPAPRKFQGLCNGLFQMCGISQKSLSSVLKTSRNG